MLDTKTDNSSNECLFTDEKSKANIINNSALDRKGNNTIQSCEDNWWSGMSKGDSQPSVLRDNHLKPLSTVWIMVAHASIANSKPKVELDSHADMCSSNNCLVIHNPNRPVNIYSYDPKDGHRSANTVDATAGYHYPQSGQKIILMIFQAICIDGLVNHLLCPMQCFLNGVQISEVPKVLAENPNETTPVIELFNPFNDAHSLMILLQ